MPTTSSKLTDTPNPSSLNLSANCIPFRNLFPSTQINQFRGYFCNSIIVPLLFKYRNCFLVISSSHVFGVSQHNTISTGNVCIHFMSPSQLSLCTLNPLQSGNGIL